MKCGWCSRLKTFPGVVSCSVGEKRLWGGIGTTHLFASLKSEIWLGREWWMFNRIVST